MFKPLLFHSLFLSFLIVGSFANAQSVLHYWSFNDDTDFETQTTPDITLGEGSLNYTGEWDDVNDGSSINLQNEYEEGRALRLRNPAENEDFTLSLPTTDHQDIVFSYACWRTTNGAQLQSITYTTDGETFTSNGLNENTIAINEEKELHTFDFSTIPGVNDNPDFAIRINFDINADGEDGNNRFDNITLEGNSITGEDLVPPAVTDIHNETNDEIVIEFDKVVNQTAENTDHYTGIPGLSSAVRGANNTEVTLTYTPAFEYGTVYQLSIEEIENSDGTAMNAAHEEEIYLNPLNPGNFPYQEGFEATFPTGESMTFISPGWTGSDVTDDGRIYQVSNPDDAYEGSRALGLRPTGSHDPIITIDADMSSISEAYINFFLATRASDGTRKTELLVAFSQDGISYDIEPVETFLNEDRDYIYYSIPVPDELYGQENAKIRLIARTPTDEDGSNRRTLLLIDDFTISDDDGLEDIPPMVEETEIISAEEVIVRFNEEVSETAENTDNYTGIPELTSAERIDNNTAVRLSFDPAFDYGTIYSLDVSEVEDLSGNPMEAYQENIYYNPLRADNMPYLEAFEADFLIGGDIIFLQPGWHASEMREDGRVFQIDDPNEAYEGDKVLAFRPTSGMPEPTVTLSADMSGIADESISFYARSKKSDGTRITDLFIAFYVNGEEVLEALVSTFPNEDQENYTLHSFSLPEEIENKENVEIKLIARTGADGEGESQRSIVLIDNFRIGEDTATSIENSFSSDAVSIYPNPVSERKLHISSGSANFTRAKLWNEQGILVLDQLLSSNQIDVSGLSSGLHVIELSNASTNEIFRKKVVIK